MSERDYYIDRIDERQPLGEPSRRKRTNHPLLFAIELVGKRVVHK